MADRRNSATYRAIAHPAGPASELPRTFLSALNRVVAGTGSVAGAARELGVPRRTLRRWLAGENTPSVARQAEVRRRAGLLARRSRLTIAREQRLRRANRVQIVATYRYDGTTRNLTFVMDGGDNYLSMARGTADKAVTAFLAGVKGTDDPGDYSGTSGLFGVLVDAMADYWYRTHFSLGAGDPHGFDVHTVRFG